MYKKLFLILAVIAVVAGISFAEGNKEKGVDENDWRRGSGSFSPETVELTGTISLNADGFPVLRSGGEEYVLMYPYFLDDDLEIQEGDEISVEGFLAPHPRRAEDDDATYVRVTKAIIDGEEYEIPHGPRSNSRGSGRRGCWGDDDDFRGKSSRRGGGKNRW